MDVLSWEKRKKEKQKGGGSKGKVVSLKLQANIPVVINPPALPPPVICSFLYCTSSFAVNIKSPLGYKGGAEEQSQSRGGSWTGGSGGTGRGRGALRKEPSTGGDQHPIEQGPQPQSTEQRGAADK